jgi:hypothetical protein
MRRNNVFLYTSLEKNFPEFLCASQNGADGSIVITVRGHASEDNGYFEPGEIASITVPKDEIVSFVAQLAEIVSPNEAG